MLIEQNNIYIAYHSDDNGFRFVKSTDLGDNWDNAVTIDDNITSGINPSLTVQENNTSNLYAVASKQIDDGGTLLQEIVLYKSQDSGDSWNEISVIDSNSSSWFLYGKVKFVNNTLYVAYVNQDDNTLLMAVSKNKGESWQKYILATDVYTQNKDIDMTLFVDTLYVSYRTRGGELPSTFNVIEFWINSEDEASLYQINEYLYSTPEAMDTDDLPLVKPSSTQSNDAILFSYEDASGERRIFRKEVEESSVNFKPTIISSDTFYVSENLQSGTVVGQVVALDYENEDITYYLDDSSGNFSIDSETGIITLNHMLDYEDTQSYTLSVGAYDKSGNYDTQTITINVLDSDDSNIILTQNATTEDLQEAISNIDSSGVLEISPNITITQGGEYHTTISIGKDITIEGNNSTIDFEGAEYGFSIGSSASVTINNLTIKRVFDTTEGAISNEGTLSLNRVILTQNSSAEGGAIYNTGTLEIQNSSIYENNSTNYGGAIYNSGELSIINSTIAFNKSGNKTGVIYSSHDFKISHSTIAFNENGGVVVDESSTSVIFSLKNSIVTDNEVDINGSVSSYGYNIIQESSYATFTGGENDNDTIGTSAWEEPYTSINTSTSIPSLPIEINSFAFDMGTCYDIDNQFVFIDQLSTQRPKAQECDIGSYEVDTNNSAPTITFKDVSYDNISISRTLSLSGSIRGVTLSNDGTKAFVANDDQGMKVVELNNTS